MSEDTVVARRQLAEIANPLTAALCAGVRQLGTSIYLVKSGSV